jgi:hypothetical protein
MGRFFFFMTSLAEVELERIEEPLEAYSVQEQYFAVVSFLTVRYMAAKQREG